MRNLCIALFCSILFSCSSNNAQQNNIIQQEDITVKNFHTMKDEKFNIDEFNLNQVDGMWTYTDSMVTTYTYRKIAKRGFLKQVRKKNSHFVSYVLYWLNGNPREVAETFRLSGFKKGVERKYDEQGNLISEIDYDSLYKQSWEDIMQFMQDRGIDIDDRRTFIARVQEEDKRYWSIEYDTGKMSSKGEKILKIIDIDGETGNIINEELKYLEEW